MRFCTIEPAKSNWELVDAKAPQELYGRLGLGGNVDHGVVAPPSATPSGVGISIVVDGFGLFKQPPEAQRYFAIGRQLYGGNALLYGFDNAGETVDLQEVPMVIFITPSGIEGAIASGQIDRPSSSFNGEKFWEWPQPNPFKRQ